MGVENLIQTVGGFGCYQWLLMGFVFLTTFMNGVNYYAQVFMFTPPPHNCPGTNNDKHANQSEQIHFNMSYIFPTIASENYWVCEHDSKPNMVEMGFWMGNIAGFMVTGHMNDKFGRRPTVLASHIIYVAGDALTFVAPEFYTILAARFLVGAAHMTISHLPYMLALEFCEEKTRIVPLLTIMFSYSLSSIVTPLVSMYLTSWRILLAMATFPNLIVIFAYFLDVIPESPAWLLCRGRISEAEKMLRKAAKINGVEVDLKQLENSLSECARGHRESAFFGRTRKSELLRRLTSNCRFFTRASVSLMICFIAYTCYYGHVGNTANIGGSDIFLNYVYGAAIEMGVVFSIPILLNRIGRRWTLIGMSIAATSSSLACVFADFEQGPDFTRVFAILGRVFAAGAYYSSLQFASELFPTEIRGKGSSAFEICGGIGLFIQPKINYLGKSLHASVPLVIYGGLGFVAIMLSLCLPETANEELPQTIEEAEHFGAHQTFLQCVVCKNRVHEDEAEINA